MSSQRCKNPNCGSYEIDFSEASGDAVCVVCGTVCEESTIVSSIEFSEGAGGSSCVVGQFVSASCTKPYGGFGAKGKARYGFLRSSRETTLATGRRKIAQVASTLRLGSYYVDGAHRLFAMAAQRNFTQGRKALHVACACLYVMCRREKSAHMLIDFSDVLQVNVYALGSTFLKFRRLLNLELPIIDPSLYIHRFAAKLELGDKAGAVCTTALRVVQRMRRDWIETGRRPAGVCAAALLIGARAHGFHRTQEDVVRALRVCGVTVSRRLADFERTPAAQLSLSEFSERALEIEAEEHPPSFQRAEQQRRLLLENGEACGHAMVVKDAIAITTAPPHTPPQTTQQPPRLPRTNERSRELSRAREQLYEEIKEMLELDAAERPVPKKVQAAPRAKDAAFDENGSDDDFEDVDDADIDGFILNDDEMAKKSEVWTKLNRDYLDQQDEKEKLARARAEANGETYEEHQNRKRQPKRSKRSSRSSASPDRKTPREAMMDVCERRRFSKKINYAALVGIFGEDAEEASPARQLVGGANPTTKRGVERTDDDDRPRLVAVDASLRTRDEAAPCSRDFPEKQSLAEAQARSEVQVGHQGDEDDEDDEEEEDRNVGYHDYDDYGEEYE